MGRVENEGSTLSALGKREGIQPQISSYTFQLILAGVVLNLVEVVLSFDWLMSVPYWVRLARIAMIVVLAGYLAIAPFKDQGYRLAIWVALVFFVLMQTTFLYSRSPENAAFFTAITILASSMLATQLRDLCVFFLVAIPVAIAVSSYVFEPIGYIGLFILGIFAIFFGHTFLQFRNGLNATLVVLGKSARQDALTGLGNRRAYEETIEALLANFERYEFAFSVIVIDIDRFKNINDEFGHDAGDAVLRGIADCIRHSTRTTDHSFTLIESVYRFGGEEFVVLLPRASDAQAKLAAERIRQNVAETPFKSGSAANDLISVTVSIGLATCREGSTVKSIFTDADTALYQAKQNGRNRVETFEP